MVKETRIVITGIQRDIMTQRPVFITISIFSKYGVEQFRTTISSDLFTKDLELEIGNEVVLTPKIKTTID